MDSEYSWLELHGSGGPLFLTLCNDSGERAWVQLSPQNARDLAQAVLNWADGADWVPLSSEIPYKPMTRAERTLARERISPTPRIEEEDP